MRNYKLYLDDMLEAIRKIEKYTKGIDVKSLRKYDLIIDGVVRNLEIIGEAAKKIPPSIKEKSSVIEWKKISGLRDILIHEYFGVDLDVVWDIVKNKIPDLKKNIRSLYRLRQTQPNIRSTEGKVYRSARRARKHVKAL